MSWYLDHKALWQPAYRQAGATASRKVGTGYTRGRWSQILILPDGTTSSEITIADKPKELPLFPNPVSYKLFLSEVKEFSMHSTMGIRMMNGKGSEINMTHLPNVLYIIVIDNLSYKVLKRD